MNDSLMNNLKRKMKDKLFGLEIDDTFTGRSAFEIMLKKIFRLFRFYQHDRQFLVDKNRTVTKSE